jgi:hypothetical protein
MIGAMEKHHLAEAELRCIQAYHETHKDSPLTSVEISNAVGEMWGVLARISLAYNSLTISTIAT